MKKGNLDLRQLQMSLDKSDPELIYSVFGDEIYLIDESLKLLKKQALKDGLPEFNFDQFYASDTKAAQVRDLVETLPMMGARRVVFYKQANLLKEKDWEALLPILENPVDTCVLVLVSEKWDKRKKYYKLMQKNAVLVELKRPYDNQVASWVRYIGDNHELEIGGHEAELIHQLVGNNLTEINNEVQKLKQFIGDKAAVSIEDISNVVSRARVDSVFDLTDAIGGGQKLVALSCLKNLMEHGQSEVGVVMLIARHMRLIQKVKSLVGKRASATEISQQVGVPPFFVKKYMAQARIWQDEKLNNTFKVLYEADKALKSSSMNSHIVLQNCVFQIS